MEKDISDFAEPFLPTHSIDAGDRRSNEYQDVGFTYERQLSPPSSRVRRILSCVGVVILSFGWVIAIALLLKYPLYFHGTSELSINRSPISFGLQTAVKKVVFDMDERYVGPSEEANHHWTSLIAGENKALKNPDSKY
jgi:hypothetical protein